MNNTSLDEKMKTDNTKIIEEKVKEIMQSGFDVAMGGDPFHDPEENKRILEKKYDQVVSEHTQFLLKALDQKEREAYDEGVYACRIGEEKCPRHLSSLRCINCIEELQISSLKEKGEE